MVTAARSLRRFFRYAYQQGWCQNDVAAGILAPRLFRHENLPQGPAWTDVHRLLAATNTERPGDVRNRAILWLFAVYGLRSGEVARLRLSDLDWGQHILQVRRSKSNRVHEYPLTLAATRLLQRYVEKVRPHCEQQGLFLTRTAPFRPLSPGALYDLARIFHKRSLNPGENGCAGLDLPSECNGSWCGLGADGVSRV
jgi:site-specific recombinase XerD